MSTVLHTGVLSRHIIRTVPAMFHTTFSQTAAVLWSAFMRCGAPCLDDFSRTSKGKTLRGGSITGLHPHGRNGHAHPPRPLLAPSGGYESQGARWEHLQDVPYELLRRTWPWHVLSRLRQTRKTDAVHQWVEMGCRTSPNGPVTTVHQGTVPSPSQSLARSVAQSVVRPPIAVRRMDRDAGERVTSHDRSHRTDRMEHDTVEAATCIGRMVPHAMPTGCKRLRYDGVQATKTFPKVQRAMQAALTTGAGVVKGAVQIMAR